MFQSHRLITKSHYVAVGCSCLAWTVASTVDVGFSAARMYYEANPIVNMNLQREAIFWSEYDIVGGNGRGVVVLLDSFNPYAAFVADTLPLALGHLSAIMGVQGTGGGTAFFLNLSDTDASTLNKVSVVAGPSLNLDFSIPCSSFINIRGGDGIQSGNYYFAATDGVEVFDLTGPASIGTLDESGTAPEIRGIDYRASDKVLFANCATDQIRAYDLSDVNNPAFISSIFINSTNFSLRKTIKVEGDNYLYAMTDDGFGNAVISIFDVTDPSAMAYVDVVYTSPSHTTAFYGTFDIQIAGCLIAMTNGGIVSFDITNPANPVLCTSSPAGNSHVAGFGHFGLQMVLGTDQDLSVNNKAIVLVPA